MSHLHHENRGELLTQIASRTLGTAREVDWRPSPKHLQHRSRIKLGVQNGQIGYRKGRSHELAPIDTCEIARPEVNEGLEHLRRIVANNPTVNIEEVEVRSDSKKVAFDMYSGGRLAKDSLDIFHSLEHVSLNGKRVHGDPTLHLDVGPLTLRASPGVFYQVNLDVNALLVEFVTQQVIALKPVKVLDLFSGIGNFGLQLAHRNVDVIAVEQPGRAIDDCRHSAAQYQLQDRIQVMAMNAKKFQPSRTFFDVVIADPPRVGTMGTLQKLLQNRPTDIFYISCHLSGAAHEIKDAKKSGYDIASVTCFDMFPKTHHFETVIHLKRT